MFAVLLQIVCFAMQAISEEMSVTPVLPNKAIKEEQMIERFEGRSFLWGGRLRIPCGSGYVTLPAMTGVG